MMSVSYKLDWNQIHGFKFCMMLEKNFEKLLFSYLKKSQYWHNMITAT